MSSVRINFLIVDDSSDLRTTFSYTFTSLGYNVRSAEDGFTALAEIRNMTPDILLSDLNMPGMSGFELLSVVRRRFPAIQVIAMSGAFSGEGLQLGVAADAFYEKGADFGSLLQTVETMAKHEQPPSARPSGSLIPIWVPRNGHYLSDVPTALINCPECLRSFPHILGEAVHLIHETACVFCSHPVYYALLEPTDPASPQAFQRKPAGKITFIPSPNDQLLSQ